MRQPSSECWHGAPAWGADAETIAAPECVAEQACEVGIAPKTMAGASRAVTAASNPAITRVLVLRNRLVIRFLVAS